jgi:preprotein translocase subunit SecD
MGKFKDIFTSWQVIILILVILGSVLAINPHQANGVQITSVETNSSAELNGVQKGFIITGLNDQTVKTTEDFTAAVNQLQAGKIAKVQTDKGQFSFVVEDKNNATFTGIEVKDRPTSNLKQGLDLVGGVRVLLQPEEQLAQSQLDDVVAITQRRLNTFGLADVNVREVSDFDGNTFILVEMAGTTQQELVDLISQQGKFEAKIGNETVFLGPDIKSVCRSADCAGIMSCDQTSDGKWACRYQFRVDVSSESAKKHAEITNKLTVVNVGGESYLSEKLDLYLDDELTDSLYISSDLQGQEATSFVIAGPGVGSTKEAAMTTALDSMKRFQTLLITGSLPVKLKVVRMDVVSATLGQQFLKSALIALFVAIGAVGVIIFARYRSLKIAAPILITSLSEVLIIFGIAALIKWNIDLAAIAGILATVGTGVDAQIVITDEVLEGKKATFTNWKERLKRALFIIFGSYATVVAAMIPLWGIGAGLLKGFAIVTIIGATIGVFITRQAYAKIIEALTK